MRDTKKVAAENLPFQKNYLLKNFLEYCWWEIRFHISNLYFYLFDRSILECTSDKENWMCLNCGQVLCGRYENGHALHHSTLNTQHNVCLNTLNCSVYCYKCDDFVINGKHLLDNLREEFKDDDSSSEASNSLDESSSIKSSKGSASTSSSDSGWYDESTPGVTSPIIGRRQLRPRKRTNSNQNENGNESPTKKKLLRKVSGNELEKHALDIQVFFLIE